MPLSYSILSLFLLLGALGLGYVGLVGHDSDQDQLAKETTLDDTTDQQAQDRTDADQASALSGSADRRMDDFGSGPGGKVVMVPLQDRHRQAFSGQTGAAGGGPGRSQEQGQQEPGSVETAALAEAGQSESETQAYPAELQASLTPKGDDEGDPDNGAASKFRVIEREQEDNLDAGKTEAEKSVVTPSFDIVRVDPLGNAILAGRAAPFAEVDVKAGDEVIDSVTATELGEWVSTPIKPLGSGDQEISLSASSESTPAIPSKQVVVVSIPEPAERQVQEVDEPVAVLLDREKGGEGKVLQAPGRLQGEGQLALKLVDYDDEGAIKLSGEAPPGAPVRIYIDNEPAALVIGDAKGYWITTLDSDLPGGDYTLRLDQLDKKGETVARLETPLTRVTTPPVEGESKVDYVVVQPGNSLWRIARRLSGDGFNYVYIFEANQAQIRDPDVIYPGQVFEVPSETGIAG